MAEVPQADLLARIATGDKAAFTALYRMLERPVFRFISSKLNDPHQSADILHDVFMDIWRLAGKFEGRSSVKTWVLGIAYRKTMDHFRKHSRVSVTDDLPELADETPDAATCLVASQEASHVRDCLATLSVDQRMAIELAFYEDMTYGQIAEAAQVPEGTIKTRVFHAKKLLMHCLSGRLGRVSA
ncbi:MAG: sigma-70 family RNA polymerase sigma factor [Deltaproteobacteria bacterium]